MDYKKIIDEVSNFAKEQGDWLLSQKQAFSIEKFYDQGADISTNLDQEVEKRFFDFAQNNYPEFGFIGEEDENLHKDLEYNWYIDPIDGTKWFIKDIPLWTISIALVEEATKEPVLGVIYHPETKNLYYAAKGLGSFRNRQKLSILSEVDPLKVQIAIDLTSHKSDWNGVSDQVGETIKKLFINFYKVRGLGSGSLSLAWLAQGMFAAYVNPYQYDYELVDTAAGLIIAKEAGATIYRKKLTENTQQLIVSNEQILEELKKYLA